MLPSVVGNSLKMSEIDLNEYVAVPGKIIPIPGIILRRNAGIFKNEKVDQFIET